MIHTIPLSLTERRFHEEADCDVEVSYTIDEDGLIEVRDVGRDDGTGTYAPVSDDFAVWAVDNIDRDDHLEGTITRQEGGNR